jgi:hypothetical protein
MTKGPGCMVITYKQYRRQKFLVKYLTEAYCYFEGAC